MCLSYTRRWTWIEGRRRHKTATRGTLTQISLTAFSPFKPVFLQLTFSARTPAGLFFLVHTQRRNGERESCLLPFSVFLSRLLLLLLPLLSPLLSLSVPGERPLYHLSTKDLERERVKSIDPQVVTSREKKGKASKSLLVDDEGVCACVRACAESE